MGIIKGLIKLFFMGFMAMTIAFKVCDPGSASQQRARAKKAIIPPPAHPAAFYDFDTVYRGK